MTNESKVRITNSKGGLDDVCLPVKAVKHEGEAQISKQDGTDD